MILRFKKLNFKLLKWNIFLFFLAILEGIKCKAYSQATEECITLTLTEAVSCALNSNRQLLGIVESLTTAQYGIDLAESEFNIGITPNSQASYVGGDRGKPEWMVGGGVEISKKFTTGTLVSVAPSIIKTGKHYLTDIQAMVTQPLLRGLGREYQLANLRGAQFALRAAYRNLYIAQVQLIMRTIQTLYEIVKSEQSLLLNQESYQRIRQFYQAAKLKEKIGLSDALDVYRAEIELRHAEDALKGNRERLEEAKDTLRDLLALPLDTCINIEIPLLYTPHSIDLDKAVEMALNHRIEIDQAQDERRENERLSRLAKKNLYPELNLVFNYSNVGRARHFTTSCTQDRENIWGVGFTTSTDLNPLADQIAYEQSLIAIDAASRGIDQTEATIILEVKKAVRQLDRAFERIHLQEDQIKTAQGELLLAKIKFDHSLADNFNVIQAEKSLRAAQQTYWTALIDHIVGEFQLLVAMGLLIDKPHIPY
jgi:outer membrane protein